MHYMYLYVSESDTVGPIDYLSNIENLVSLKRALFEDCTFKYRNKYSNCLCLYNRFDIHFLRIMNGVYVKHKDDTFCPLIVG